MSSTVQWRRPRFGLCILTWIVLFSVLYAIAFCQLVYPIWVQLEGIFGSQYSLPYGTGWPIPFVLEKPLQDDDFEPSRDSWEYDHPWHDPYPWPGSSPWSGPWPWEYEQTYVSKFALSIDFAVWLLLAVSTIAMLELRLRKPGRRLQLSLRGLLGMTASVAMTLAMLRSSLIESWLNPRHFSLYFGWPNILTIDLLEILWPWSPQFAVVALIIYFTVTSTVYVTGMMGVMVLRSAWNVVADRKQRNIALSN